VEPREGATIHIRHDYSPSCGFCCSAIEEGIEHRRLLSDNRCVHSLRRSVR
jgi:hypothetical protein